MDWFQNVNSFMYIWSRYDSKVSIYFKDYEFVTLKRSEMYTVADFFVLCGGLLGLLLSASVLTVMELIYYPSLRLYWMLRQRRTANEAARTLKPQPSIKLISTIISSPRHTTIQTKRSQSIWVWLIYWIIILWF